MKGIRYRAATGAAHACVVALACALVAPGSPAADDRYRFTGYLDGGTTVDRGHYSVVAPKPRGVLRSRQWRHFEDRVKPGSVILNLGAGRNYSWAATVRDKGRLVEGETVARYAARLYPRETYATVTDADASASCIATALLRDPPRGFERYYQRVAICSPAANTRVYELILSEMNLAGKEPIPGLEEAALEFIESLRFP